MTPLPVNPVNLVNPLNPVNPVNPLSPVNPVQCAKMGFGSKRSSKSRGLGSPGGLNKTTHE